VSPLVIVVIGVLVVAVVAAIAVTNQRRRNDGVDSFRRQIDALSPEARRSVVDQVQNAAERRERTDDDRTDDDRSDDRSDDDRSEDDRSEDDEDGPRGA
jgi:hypothetical protein